MPANDDVRDRLGRTVPPAGKRAVRRVARVAASATSSLRVLPDFLIIGTQRGGTTSLYHYLARHPQIAGAVMDKEVHYFDTNHDRGPGWYRGRFPTRGAVDRIARKVGAPAIVGEASPYYLFHPLVPARARELLPDVRLIAMLRDPVDRAWSGYRHEVDLGYEDLAFEDAIDREAERLDGEEARILADPTYVSFEHQHHSYLARGVYVEQVARWLDGFGADRLLLIKSEDFYRDPAPVYAEVLAFLGAGSWEPPVWRTYNAASGVPGAGPAPTGKEPPRGMSPKTYDRLRAFYRPHDERLTALVGRDFGWDG
jgi:hypothetical protein